jgi:hypothetical protein
MIKKIQTKHIFILRNTLGVILLLLISSNSFAFQLDENFRKNLTPIIRELCHSSIEYNITDTVAEKKTEYQTTINNVIKDTLIQISNHHNRRATEKKTSKNGNFQLDLPQINDTRSDQEKQDQSLNNLKTQQKYFDTQCPKIAEGSSQPKSYSCLLTESTLIEYCGYRFFLLAKTNDFISFKQEQKKLRPNINNNSQIQNLFGTAQYNYQQEIQAAETALVETLEFVRQHEKTYHQITWWELVRYETQIMFSELSKIGTPLFTFNRFVNPTQP